MNQTLMCKDVICTARIHRINPPDLDSVSVCTNATQNSIRRIEMEETTKKLAFVVIFLSVVVVTLFGLAPSV